VACRPGARRDAALGSSEAVLQLEPQLRKYNYAANLLAARPAARRTASDRVAEQCLQPLARCAFASSFCCPDSDNLPSVMRSREWQRKELQSAAASWAELRHDTILYAKPILFRQRDLRVPGGLR